MKPRNKYETFVYGLSLKLQKDKPLTESQKAWAIKTVHDKYFTTHYSNNVCLECAHKFKTDAETKQAFHNRKAKSIKVVCPSCNNSLKYAGGYTQFYGIFTIYNTHSDFQIERLFAINKYVCKGQEPTYYISEVMQKWLNVTNGKITFLAKPRAQYYNDLFHTHMNMSIQEPIVRSYTGKISLYDISFTNDIYPKKSFHPILIRNGFKLENHKGTNVFHAMKLLITHPRYESLIKSNQLDVAKYYANDNEDKVVKFINQIRIATKNRYIIKKTNDYFDYLDLLEYFQKDLNSPKYICPSDLHTEHQRLVRKKSYLLAQQSAEEKAKLEAIQTEEYRKKKQRFLDFSIEENGFKIVVPQTVKDFETAGNLLDHCIYTNSYFEKKTLILFAFKGNQLIETAEIYANGKRIKQCRGYDNKPTKDHKTIIRTIKQHLPTIQKLAQA